MTTGISDGQAEHLAVEGEEVEEVPAHLLGRHRPRGQLVAGEAGQLVEEQALLDLGGFAEAAPHPLLHQPRAEGRPDRIEGEVQLLADPALGHQEEDEVAVRPAPHGQGGRGAAGQDPGPGRRAVGRGVGEDVDPVLEGQARRSGGRVEALAGRPAQLAHHLHEVEALPALGVERRAAQAKVLPQRPERVFQERPDDRPAGPGRVQAAEQAVQPAIEELGLEMGRAVHGNL